ncbi:MAG: molybdopterin-dependent oxidoreductase [Ktedonobacteraceae bacterium]|nr:molybdopterin-dependent oxidoreductase [Ktedonobacteraceae bacterium]
MQIMLSSKKSRFKSGFVAGLVAGILASALMLLLNVTLGGVSLPDVLSSAIALALPVSLFNSLHQLIGGDAKYYLFLIVLVGQCFVFALFGGLCNLLLDPLKFAQARDEQGRLEWSVGFFLAFVLWVLTGCLFLPLVGGGLFGAQLVTGVVNTMLSLAVVGVLFGATFVYAHNWLLLNQQRRQATTKAETAWIDRQKTEQRRSFVRTGFTVLGLGALGWAAWRFIIGGGSGGSTPSQSSQSTILKQYKGKVSPPPTPNYGTVPNIPQLSSEVTANKDYYVVSKNITSDPTVDGASWQLNINGQVQSAYKLTYKDVMAMPMKKQYESMMCISNEVGGSYMSNALWEGIPLKDLLERAGTIKPGATKVVLHAADGYTDSIHLAKALEPTTLVAIRMNGETLPQGHGYPARLLVPGIYGMKHVKWITQIEVVNTDYKGYWQQSGWSDPAPIHMTTRIDTPLSGGPSLKADKPTYVAGVAFSGNKGISEVDVSLDGGQTWQIATLKQPLSALTWVLWQIPWQPQQAGNYTVVARAIDMEGNVQDPQLAPPLPDGSSGYHSINVSVS